MAKTIAGHLDIRLLKNEEDWLAFQDLRLAALQEHPEAFGSSYEEESIMSAESFKEGYKLDFSHFPRTVRPEERA
jgi:hypothetical protein